MRAVPVFLALLSTVACSGGDEGPPDLADAGVRLPAFDSVEVQMAAGEGALTAADGTVTVRAGLTDWRGVQDLDGDGDLEAVAVVWSSGGGTGLFMDLAAFDLNRNGWVWRGSVPLGDRTRVRVFALDGDVVLLHMTEHGPDDPSCCPSVATERRFRLVDDGFVAVENPGGP